MNIRHAYRAGSFYEASASSCRHHANKLLTGAELPEDLPKKLFGGLAPHAGWTYSGALAATTFKALGAAGTFKTVVLLGADHTGAARRGEVFDSGVWRTPLGEAQVDEKCAAALIGACEAIRANPGAHDLEHSIEVQVPLIQATQPKAKIVPIAVAATDEAVEIGRAIGKVLGEKFHSACVVGSTDLTHHGGHFPAPGGRGEAGERWSRRNDQRLLELVEKLAAEQIISEVDQHANACGAGAVAACLAACREMGATRGIVLDYTNSYRIVHDIYPNTPDDTTVGYASVVFV